MPRGAGRGAYLGDAAGAHGSGAVKRQEEQAQQAVIPVTMLLSVALLRKQYHVFQYLGATTIVLGIVMDKATI